MGSKGWSGEDGVDGGAGGCGGLEAVVEGGGRELRINLPAESLDDSPLHRPSQRALHGSDVLLKSAAGALTRQDVDQMLEPLGFFLERRDLLFRLRSLAAQQRDQMFLARMGRGDRLLTLLNDLSCLDDFLLPLGHLGVTRTQLLCLGIETRDRAGIARCEIGQHRHRLDRIAALVDLQKNPHLTETAQTIKRHETAAEKIALTDKMLCDRVDLRLQIALLPFEI